MMIKRFIAVICLLLCVSAVLCACQSDEGWTTEMNLGPTNTTSAPTEATEGTIPMPSIPSKTEATTPSKLSYTVTVVDGDGNPVEGVTLQFCDDTGCRMPIVSNAEGKAVGTYTPSNYHVTVTAPEGYTAEQTEYYFDEGSTELTITLSAA